MSANSSRQLLRLLDPMDALRDALACPELDTFDSADGASVAAAGAACDLATALGWCRLLDRKIDEGLDGVLRLDMANAAAVELRRRLEHWTEDARTLEDRCRSAVEPVEAEELCLAFLHLRMDAWAAQVAIDEACMDTWDMPDEHASGQLESAITALNEGFDAFDEELRDRQHILCVAADTPLLDNWRSLLHPAYGDCLPWWLDGTLENVPDQNAEGAFAAQPAADGSGEVSQPRQRDARPDAEDRPPQKFLATVSSHPATPAEAAVIPRTVTGHEGNDRRVRRFPLEPLPAPTLAAASHPLPISSLPQSESLVLEDGGILHCTVFHNAEGKIVVTFRTSAKQLTGRHVLLTAIDQQDGNEVLKVSIALAPDDAGILSGTFDLVALDLRRRHMIEFMVERRQE